MGTYEILELILFLISSGFIGASELRNKVEEAKASGKTDREVGDILKAMADQAIAEGYTLQGEPPPTVVGG
jgi:hypothetical protein